MISNSHPISCVTLTKSILNELLQTPGNSYTACLVSSLGNIFVIGDVENFEIIVVDEHHEQYIIEDAGETSRTILFHGESSDHGVLVSSNGFATSSTGIVSSPTDDEGFIEFVKHETGDLGQECLASYEVSAEVDEELH